MNTSKIRVRIKGDPPGIPRNRYDIFSLEKKSFRRFYPRSPQPETLLSRIGVIWQGELKTARLREDPEGKLTYEFSIETGWRPTPNHPNHEELISLAKKQRKTREESLTMDPGNKGDRSE